MVKQEKSGINVVKFSAVQSIIGMQLEFSIQTEWHDLTEPRGDQCVAWTVALISAATYDLFSNAVMVFQARWRSSDLIITCATKFKHDVQIKLPSNSTWSDTSKSDNSFAIHHQFILNIQPPLQFYVEGRPPSHSIHIGSILYMWP